MALHFKTAQDKRREERWRFIVTSGALVLALSGAISMLFFIRNDDMRRGSQARMDREAQRAADQQALMVQMTARLAEVEKRYADSQKQILAAMAHAGGSFQGAELKVADRQALEEAERSNQALSQRLTALEGALSQTPEKAVALPLLRQQLTDVQDKNKDVADSLHGEINRLYGMMQWFLGLMITLIIGVGGLAVNSFRQGGERHKTQSTEKPNETIASPLPAGIEAQ